MQHRVSGVQQQLLHIEQRRLDLCLEEHHFLLQYLHSLFQTHALTSTFRSFCVVSRREFCLLRFGALRIFEWRFHKNDFNQ
jgi:hypothetical protein